MVESVGAGANAKKMEQALNEWLQRVEEQVNSFDTEKASLFDLQQLELKLSNEVRERSRATDQVVQIAQNAERIATRLADDTLASVEEVQRRMAELEERQSQMSRYLETKIQQAHNSVSVGSVALVDSVGKQLDAGDTFRSHNISHSDFAVQLKMLDDKLSKRMADSVEQLAEILKEQARKQRRINDRVGEIESKIFGNTRDDKPKKAKVRNGLNTSNMQKENSFIKANKSPMRKTHSPPVKEKKRTSAAKHQSKR